MEQFHTANMNMNFLGIVLPIIFGNLISFHYFAILKPELTLGRVLPYLAMVGRFGGDDPPFVRYSIRMGPYFMPHHDLNESLFLQKKWCLYRI